MAPWCIQSKSRLSEVSFNVHDHLPLCFPVEAHVGHAELRDISWTYCVLPWLQTLNYTLINLCHKIHPIHREWSIPPPCQIMASHLQNLFQASHSRWSLPSNPSQVQHAFSWALTVYCTDSSRYSSHWSPVKMGSFLLHPWSLWPSTQCLGHSQLQWGFDAWIKQ